MEQSWGEALEKVNFTPQQPELTTKQEQIGSSNPRRTIRLDIVSVQRQDDNSPAIVLPLQLSIYGQTLKATLCPRAL